MGIRLVQAALSPEYFGLSDRAHRVLVHMALVAHDRGTEDTPRGVWWEGHDALILRVIGTDPRDMDARSRAAAERSIRRAVRELRDAGAITLVDAARPGRHARYRVCPTPVDNTVDNEG